MNELFTREKFLKKIHVTDVKERRYWSGFEECLQKICLKDC